MHEKLTYEELEQRVKDLEQENLELLKETAEIESEMIPEDIDLKSIINVDEIQSILDEFHYLTNMVTALLDTKGEVIESTGWQDICTKFHRAHPETAHNCTKSDLYLAKNLKPGEYIDYKCQNGLWDVVTPLYVGKKHLGNIFTGQFFYDDENVDENFFIKQAEKYGFEKDSYLEAFRRIPRYNKDTIDHLMSFLVKFTTYISKIGLVNIKLEKEITERKQAEKALRAAEQLFSYYMDNIDSYVYIKDRESNYTFINKKTEKLFNTTREDLKKKKYTDFDFFDEEMAKKLRENDR
jgi:ligand-binding sensor protein